MTRSLRAKLFESTSGKAILLALMLAPGLSLTACDDEEMMQPDPREPVTLVSDPTTSVGYEGPAPSYSKVTVFSKDVLLPGYLHFRIPALVATKSGALLAFSEMRTGGDLDPKTLVYRRSTDNGETWGPVTLLEEQTITKVYGNETVVVDRDTGKIHLLYLQVFPTTSGNTGNMYHKVSSDDGVTWSARTLMPNVINAAWRPAGPGTGIQLERGEHAGRLVVPGRYSDAGKSGNYILYSDDAGETWQAGFKSLASPANGILENETTCVELVGESGSDSRIYINARNQSTAPEGVDFKRLEAYSDDSGESLSVNFRTNTFIRTERVQASLLRWSATDKGQSTNRILFSSVTWAPTFDGGGAQSRRRHVGVWSSFDETESWSQAGKRIHDVKGGYSSMAKTADGLIGILFEEGPESYFSETSLVKINEAFLDVPLIGAKWDAEDIASGQTVGAGETLSDVYEGGTARPIEIVGGPVGVVAGSEVYKQKSAIDLDGTSYLRLADGDTWTQFDFNEQASFTVEVIVKTSQSREQFLAGRPHQPGWPQWFLQVDSDGRATFRIDDDEKFSAVTSQTEVNDGMWHHIAAVRDRDSRKLKIYVDGELSAEADDAVVGSLANRRPLFIGGTDDGRRLTGQIDLVRISPVKLERFFDN